MAARRCCCLWQDMVFVHLAGAQGLAAQADQEPLGGFYPTDAWLPLTPVTHRQHMALPPDAPPGDYQLLVGLYDPATDSACPAADRRSSGRRLSGRHRPGRRRRILS